MELMSFLLLCALAALVPLTLGILPPSEIKMDDLKLIGKTPVASPKVMLNPNSPIVLAQNKESILGAPKCQHCRECMEMVMASRPREQKHVSYSVPNVEEAYANDILESYHQYKSFREKRQFEKFEEKTPINLGAVNRMRKNKAVTVTKYSNSGQVYALKIKEEDLDGGDQDSDTACRVYRVKKYYPCDVPDGDLMKLFAKKKGKRTKKIQAIKHKKSPTRSIHTTISPKAFSEAKGMKTLGDTSQMVENFMTSIEEMY